MKPNFRRGGAEAHREPNQQGCCAEAAAGLGETVAGWPAIPDHNKTGAGGVHTPVGHSTVGGEQTLWEG